MKIGIDIDNVIANTFVDLFEYFNRYMGKKLEPVEVARVMKEEKLKMLGYWFVTWKDKLLSKVNPIEGAAEVLKALHADHTITLITSRMSVFNKETHEWLKKHGMSYHALHHAKELNKHKKAVGHEIFIEDNLEECEVLANHCKKVFLFDHPWNRKPIKGKNIIRVKNWREIKEGIEG